jgi:hypothetical protein
MMVRFKRQNKKNKGNKSWMMRLIIYLPYPTQIKIGSPADDSNIGHVPLLSVVLPNWDKQLAWTNQLKFCVLILHEGKAGLKMYDRLKQWLAFARSFWEINGLVILCNKEITGFIVICKFPSYSDF